jgi:hypothetical protein
MNSNAAAWPTKNQVDTRRKGGRREAPGANRGRSFDGAAALRSAQSPDYQSRPKELETICGHTGTDMPPHIH